MTRRSRFGGLGCMLVLAGGLADGGCSTSRGTNTGNGTPACPYLGPCSGAVSATAPDGHTYRGRVWPEAGSFQDPAAQPIPNPPVAKLEFGGEEVEYSDGGCHDNWPNFGGARLQVEIFIAAADGSIDGAGTLHVHAPQGDRDFPSGPWDYPVQHGTSWAVDLTLTAEGMLTATLSTTGAYYSSYSTGGAQNIAGAAGSTGGSPSDAGDAGVGGAGGFGGAGGTADASSNSTDAGAVIQRITISGPVACAHGTIPVSGGAVFTLPCRPPKGFCDTSNG